MQLPTLILLAVAVAILFFSASCHASKRRFIGRWHSNQSLTLPTWPLRETLALEDRAYFDALFGKLTITYTLHDMVAVLPAKDGGETTLPRVSYRIVASDAGSITIAYKDILTGQPTTRTNHFDGPNRYWVTVGTSIKSGREYFDRVKP